jgi:lipopolysaccharide/colanic/teichoic acid biosynthesis glycosyltransferase
MISDRKNGAQTLVAFCQCIAITAAFWLWFYLGHQRPYSSGDLYRFFVYNNFVLLGLILGSPTFHSEFGLQTLTFEEATRRSLGQLRTILFYLLLAILAADASSITWSFPLSFVPLLYFALFATNRHLPVLFSGRSFVSDWRQKVLLVGPRTKARQVKCWLDRNHYLGLTLAGLLTDEEEDGNDATLPKLGRPCDLEKLLDSPGVGMIIVAELTLGDGRMLRYTNLCEEHGVRLVVVADIDRAFGQPFTVFEDGGMCFLGLRDEPLQDPVNRLFKRCFDIAVSLPVVLFVLPILASCTWIIQRFQSPGPLLYLQLRQGFYNQPFNILKLRTMHLADSADLSLPKSKDDPRLYPVGSFLRKCSLDEMVQFVNVLRGDMSVVGPRPHLSLYNEQYRKVFQRTYVRSFVKPGITGLAQVRGYRGNAATPQDIIGRMEADIEYLETWSLSLDCWLVLRTMLLVVIPPKTAV